MYLSLYLGLFSTVIAKEGVEQAIHLSTLALSGNTKKDMTLLD